MAEKFYQQFLWCEKYGMWCDDVPDLTDNRNDCNGNCTECEQSQNVKIRRPK